MNYILSLQAWSSIKGHPPMLSRLKLHSWVNNHILLVWRDYSPPPHIILFWFVSRQNEMRNTSWGFSAPRQHGDAWNIKHNRQQEYLTQRKHDGQTITNVNNQTHIVTYSYNSFQFRHFKSSTFILFLEMHKIIMQSPTFSANQMNVQ